MQLNHLRITQLVCLLGAIVDPKKCPARQSVSEGDSPSLADLCSLTATWTQHRRASHIYHHLSKLQSWHLTLFIVEFKFIHESQYLSRTLNCTTQRNTRWFWQSTRHNPRPFAFPVSLKLLTNIRQNSSPLVCRRLPIVQENTDIQLPYFAPEWLNTTWEVGKYLGGEF